MRAPFRRIGLAALLVVACAFGVAFVAGGPGRHQAVVGSAAGPATSPAAAAASSNPFQAPSSNPTGVAPSPAATAPAPSLAQFVCGSTTITSRQSPPTAFLNAVRTGSHPGYDRVTIQFGNGQPASIELRPQARSTFTRSPRGDSVTLLGQAGLQVIIRGADAHTSFNGPTDLRTGGSALREVRQLEDFEGQIQWGLGLSGTPCYHAFTIPNPTRLVIDVPVS